MRTTFRRYSRHWLVHAIIVALAILVGVIVAFKARPTRGDSSEQPIACQTPSLSSNRVGQL